MSASSGKRIRQWTILIGPWLLALVLGTGWWLTAWTPGYLERLVPKLAADMGLPLTEFHIRDAGLFWADIGPVRIGSQSEGLRLANVHVTYSPASLRKGQVHAVILDGVSLSCAYDGENFSLPVLEMLPASGENDAENGFPELPFETLALRDSVLICRFGNRDLAVPFSADIEPGKQVHFSGRLHPRDQVVEVQGDFGPTMNDLELEVRANGLRLGAFADFLPLPLSAEADFSLQSRIDLADPAALSGDFKVSAARCDLNALGVQLDDDAVISLQGTIADRALSFSMDDVALSAPVPVRVGIRSGRINATAVSAGFALAGAGVEMDGRLEASRRPEDGSLWDVSFAAANPNRLRLEAADRIIRLNGFQFALQGAVGPQSADVVLKCDTRGAALEKSGFASGPLRMTLPLMWPASRMVKEGEVRLSGLKLDERELGDAVARVRQQGTDVAYDGTLFTGLLPGLHARFSGVSSLVANRTRVSFNVDDYALTDQFDPATLVPSMEGVVMGGVIRADGVIVVDADGIQSRMRASLSNGSLIMGENGTALRGIDAVFEMPDLLGMRSSPAQKLTFDSLEAGNIALTNGQVVYQLENGGSVLVEHVGFDWCGGHVFSNAFRVAPATEEYGVTLYCAELRLSELLSQLGLAKSEGEAALSGELPVTWKHGNIAFNSGFLHSTPGEGGTIRVEAMQNLVAAIPEGTPQRGQLELAQEAVRDYQYKWVRIKADTVGENLLVRLSVDGKPASTLPFIYRKEFGGFIRVTGDVKGSNFQGLRLDVNFSVPLDRILLYKDIVNMIQ